jgi:hypothetical protein
MANLQSESHRNRIQFSIVIPEILSFIGIVSVIIYWLTLWSAVPDRIPTHFGFSKPDAWGNKNSLTGVIIAILFFYGVFSLITGILWIMKQRNLIKQMSEAQIAEFMGLLGWSKFELILIFAYIGYITVQVALGKVSGLGVLFMPVSLIMVLGTMIFYAIRMKQRV